MGHEDLLRAAEALIAETAKRRDALLHQLEASPLMHMAGYIKASAGANLQPFAQAAGNAAPTGYSEAQADTVEILSRELRNSAARHAALLEVMDFLSAQLQMDLFKGKPGPRRLHAMVINAGIQKVIKDTLVAMGMETEVRL